MDQFGVFRFDLGVETAHNLSLSIDQELVEIPGDLACELGIVFRRSQIRIERMDVGAVNGDLGKDRKGYIEFRGAKGLDLGVCAGFLPAEIVGGKGQDFKTLMGVLFIQLLQTRILLRISALTGDIDQ